MDKIKLFLTSESERILKDKELQCCRPLGPSFGAGPSHTISSMKAFINFDGKSSNSVPIGEKKPGFE